jgi:hypothetical protein
MTQLADSLHWIAVTLWVGALWAIGYIAAPVLFYLIEDRVLAGALAGRMFSIVAYIGMGCGAYLLLFRVFRQGVYSLKQWFFWLTLLMLILTLAEHFGVQPILENLKQQALAKEIVENVFKDRFGTWHGVGSPFYLIESLLGLVLVLLQPKAAP